MKPPRSPRLVAFLNSLQQMSQDQSLPAAERIRATELAMKILTRKPVAKRPPRAPGSVKKSLEKIRKLQNEETQ